MIFILVFTWSFGGSGENFLFAPDIPTVHAAAGDIAIYRDSAGTFDANIYPFTGLPFDEVVREDALYTQNANDVDVALGSAGHYLVGYAMSVDSTATNRMVFRTKLLLDSVEQTTGQGSAYVRDSSNDKHVSYGYAVVNAASTDLDLRVEAAEVSYQSYSSPLIADESTFWILKLDDTWEYLSLEGEDAQATALSPQSVNWTVSNENTSTSLFEHDTETSPDEITLGESGHYLVTYNVSLSGPTSNTRTSATTNLSLNGTPIEQSYSYLYFREYQATNQGVSTNMSIIYASAGDVLTLEWGATGADSTASSVTIGAETGINIVRLPDSADYLRIHETTDGQVIGGTTGAVTFDTEDEEDSDSFNHDNGTVTIAQDGDYLFTFGSRSSRPSGSTRMSVKGAFYVNGSATSTGRTSLYTRGNQGAYDTYDGGMSAAAIFDLSQSEEIEFWVIDAGDNGNSDALVADAAGLTAVNIDSLFAVSEPDTISFSISATSIGFGVLSASDDMFATSDESGSSTEIAAHTIVASTNAQNGYSITISGNTLTRESFAIAAMGCTNTASSVGTEQFGIRAIASGGNGAVVSPYAASGFAFCTSNFPDEIAYDADGDNVSTTYSMRYLANIASNTEAGQYEANITYVVVANF